MSTSPQPHRSGSAPTVLMTIGSIFMLLVVIFSVAFYIWGRSGPSYGENWNDLIAAGSNTPVVIQRRTIYALMRRRAASYCGVKNSAADHGVVNGSASIHMSKKNQSTSHNQY